MTRTLLFCSRLPGTIQGGLDLRVHAQIRALLELGSVGVYAIAGSTASIDPRIEIWRASSDPAPSREIRASDTGGMLAASASPFSSRYTEQAEADLHEVIGSFAPDTIVVSRLDLAGYLSGLRGSGHRLILDLDEAAEAAQRSIAAIEPSRAAAMLGRRLAATLHGVERDALGLVDGVWVASKLERARVRASHAAIPDPSVIPNVVDVDEYSPAAGEQAVGALIYPGSFQYRPNDDAARTLIERVVPALHAATLTLVGTSMPRWLRELDHPQVRVIGQVPDIRPYLAAASIMPMPLRAGGGTRLKAIEAMASHVAVVSTELGVEGLDLEPEHHYFRAETAAEFVVQCQRLIDDPALAGRITSTAHDVVRERNSIDALVRAVRDAL